MSHALIACSTCRGPWVIELRHASVTCPRCGTKADVARRRRLFAGTADQCRAALQIAGPTRQEPLVRHDSPLDAAAAAGREHRNLSDRARTVLETLGRLLGPVAHEPLMAALVKAGLDPERAEREIVRMLACDEAFEPRAGTYVAL